MLPVQHFITGVKMYNAIQFFDTFYTVFSVITTVFVIYYTYYTIYKYKYKYI